MSRFAPRPKPRPKRRGRAVKRDKSIAQAVRDRDGTCLYGLLFQNGCYEGYDVAHIKGWGSHGREADVLENMLCLCRKHHRLHEDGLISDVTLQLVLYHFHGYGPKGKLLRHIECLRDIAKDFALSARFESKDGLTVHCYFTGTWRRVEYTFNLAALNSMDQQVLLEMARSHILRTLRYTGE